MRKQLGYYLLFFAIYTVLVIMGFFGTFIISAMTVLIAMMLPMSTFAFDDAARWNKYAAATPAGRRGVVKGKYLFALLTILAGSVLSAVFTLVLGLFLPQSGPLWEQMLVVPACAGVGVLLNAVILPFLVKFGAEKSRIISLIIFAAIFGGIAVLSQVFKSGGALPVLPAWLLSALPVVLALVAVGGFLISYFISVGIFENKEL